MSKQASIGLTNLAGAEEDASKLRQRLSPHATVLITEAVQVTIELALQQPCFL